MTFASSPHPNDCMWGQIDFASEILPGIWAVSTPSHGGLILSEERQQAMPATLRLANNQYEEDCNWSLVYLAFESEFAAFPDERERARHAHEIAAHWKPQHYASFRATRDNTGAGAAP